MAMMMKQKRNATLRKYYIVGGDRLIEKLMQTHGGYVCVPEKEYADLVIFTGGEDVTPAIYGEKRHPRTHNNPWRDAEEEDAYNFIDDTTVKAGICRGGQFLNVMNGGKMWQDVDNHTRTHRIKYSDRNGEQRTVLCTSTHHQMMRPMGDYLLWGTAHLTTKRDTGTSINTYARYDEDGEDVEIVFYPETHSLCFQPHPEYDVKECADLWFECLDRAFESVYMKLGVAA